MENTSPRARTVVPPIPAVLGAIVSVQGGAAVAKGLFPALGATTTAGLRIAISALMLVAAFRPALTRLTRAQWRVVVPFGVALGTMNAVFYLALARIPLGLAVTVEFIGPLSVAVFGSRRALDLAWVVLAGAGIALIAPWSGSGVDPLGILFALLAGACWAVYIVLGGRLSRLLAGGAAVSTAMTIATITILPFAVAAGGLARLTPRLGLAAIAVALLSSALPYSLEMVALRALPARTFSILMSLEPAVAALAGLAFLGERLLGTQWLAIVFVIVASIGATMTARETSAAVEV
ncbi:MAG: DMT family transporter [Gemmatimonadaceae bacterium]|nr:DMT family transporter [Gemmatimonadaceae bacterium]